MWQIKMGHLLKTYVKTKHGAWKSPWRFYLFWLIEWFDLKVKCYEIAILNIALDVNKITHKWYEVKNCLFCLQVCIFLTLALCELFNKLSCDDYFEWTNIDMEASKDPTSLSIFNASKFWISTFYRCFTT